MELLDALNAPEFDRWTLVDARWTSKQPVGVTPNNESDVAKQGERGNALADCTDQTESRQRR